MPFAVFDIETRNRQAIAETSLFRRRGVGTHEEAYRRFQEQSQNDFPPLTLPRANLDRGRQRWATTASCAGSERYRARRTIPRRTWRANSGRALSVSKGCLVSFNGRRFDLPVMEAGGLAIRHRGAHILQH